MVPESITDPWSGKRNVYPSALPTEIRGVITTTVSKTQYGLDLVKASDARLSIEKNMCQN